MGADAQLKEALVLNDLHARHAQARAKDIAQLADDFEDPDRNDGAKKRSFSDPDVAIILTGTPRGQGPSGCSSTASSSRRRTLTMTTYLSGSTSCYI